LSALHNRDDKVNAAASGGSQAQVSRGGPEIRADSLSGQLAGPFPPSRT
jgi:hypothetical protein